VKIFFDIISQKSTLRLFDYEGEPLTPEKIILISQGKEPGFQIASHVTVIKVEEFAEMITNNPIL
jgi:hypothetical protein